MSVLEEMLEKCETKCKVSRIKFDLYLKYKQHERYFSELDNLTIHNIPDELFINSMKSMLVNRMKKANKKKHDELCIGLTKSSVKTSIEISNFILFLKIDDIPEGVVIGNINDNERKSMFFIDILCSNPVKYSGIGKHLMDFFKSVIFLNYNPEKPFSIHNSMHLKSVNNKNTIDFYERNGMRNIEDETEESDNYPYIWKLSFMYEDEDMTEEELIDYKINDGIKWVSPRKFSKRRKMIYEDIISKPSKTIKSRKL
jgi:hypothetical protein